MGIRKKFWVKQNIEIHCIKWIFIDKNQTLRIIAKQTPH